MGPVGRLLRRLRSAAIQLQSGRREEFVDALRAFAWTNQRVHLYAADLSGGYALPRLDPRAEIRAGTRADLERFRARPEGGRTEFHRDEIDGAEPFVAFWEGEPAHIAWVYDHTRPARFVKLSAGEAELGYGYTLQAHRRRGLYPLTAGVMAAELARRGYRRLYGHIFVHSAAYAMGLDWAVRRVGFHKIGSVQHLRVLGVQLRPYLAR
jgi:hypothetical protein